MSRPVHVSRIFTNLRDEQLRKLARSYEAGQITYSDFRSRARMIRKALG